MDERPEQDPYEIEPPRSPRGEPTPRIDAEGLLEGFDEDADFERDPEVERALGGDRPTPHAAAPLGEHRRAHPDRWLVNSGWPSTGTSLIAGLVLNIGATLAAGLIAGERWGLAMLATFFACWIHAGTGVLAALTAAAFSERGLNHPERVMARMLVASSGFHLVMLLRLPTPTHLVEFLLAAGTYVILVVGQFRLPRYETSLLLISHFGLWAVVEMGVSVRAAMLTV